MKKNLFFACACLAAVAACDPEGDKIPVQEPGGFDYSPEAVAGTELAVLADNLAEDAVFYLDETALAAEISESGATVTLPYTLGSFILKMKQNDKDYTLGSLKIKVEANVPASVQTGEELLVAGSGFATDAKLVLVPAEGERVELVTVNEAGTLKAAVSCAAGTYGVLVSQAGTEQVVSESLTVTDAAVTVMNGFGLYMDMGDGPMPYMTYSVNYEGGKPVKFEVANMMSPAPVVFTIGNEGNLYTFANDDMGSVSLLLENGRVKTMTIGEASYNWEYDAAGHLTKYVESAGDFEFDWVDDNLQFGAGAYSDHTLVNQTQADYGMLMSMVLAEAENSYILVAASLLGWCGTPSANIPSHIISQNPDGSLAEMPYTSTKDEAGYVTMLGDSTTGIEFGFTYVTI